MKTTTDTQEVENNTIAKNDSNLEENPLSNDLSQKSIEEEPKVKFFKNPEYIDYIKTTIDKNYTVKEVEANTHFHQFDQLLANALLSSYLSLTDNKHILEDGIFLD